MPRLRMLKPKVATADLRRVKPAPKVGDPFYHSKEWRALLAIIIAKRGRRCEDPECRHPNGPWSMIYGDHVLERQDRPDLELDENNVMLRCPPCHGSKTARERVRRNSSDGPIVA